MPKPKDQRTDNPDLKETKTVVEIKPEVESDTFSPDERKEIIRIVRADVEYGIEVQAQNIEQKKTDLKHYHCEKPSILENLQKKSWMSDRNLGLARATADSYQAILLATCWTPDSINFIATMTSDIDNRTNQEKFTRWGMGQQEAHAGPEVDGFIHNRIVVGSSFFKIYRKTWTEWVDKRIPVKNKEGKTYKYEIKTEKVKFERGIIENIPDIDDILMPAYGKNIQELPFFIHRLHLDGEAVIDYLERKVFRPSDKEAYKKKLYNHAYKERQRVLGQEKLDSQGITVSSMTDNDVRRLTIDLEEWYGYYTKGGRTERYRMIVDLVNDEVMSGKPVRKINRSGKIPFAGGALSKEPGQLRGFSLMQIIAPVVNAFNNVFNQKSDFQYVTNCPFGFHVPSEGYTNQKYELEPMVSYPVESKPQENVYFPNLSRSMAWTESDMRILFEVLERLTGAATYFMTNTRGTSGTATRDALIDKNSETRFGLWVKRIQEDISEAVSMWFELYQDYPPKNLAERILGKDGKKVFHNLSIDTLRGDSQVQMTPDTIAGSKAYRKQMQMQAFAMGSQMVWLSPQINPSGNWELCSDTLKEVLNLSDTDIGRYLGEKPPRKFDETELSNEWHRFMSGDEFDPPEGETALALQHLEGHTKQKAEHYQDLDEEYRPIFDAHLFKTTVNAMKFIRNAQKEQAANALAANVIMQRESMGLPPPPQLGAQPAQPGINPAGPSPVQQPGIAPDMPGGGAQ